MVVIPARIGLKNKKSYYQIIEINLANSTYLGLINIWMEEKLISLLKE